MHAARRVRAAEEHATEVMKGRVGMTHDEFGKRYFSESEAAIASKIREILEKNIGLDIDICPALPDDDLADDLGLGQFDGMDGNFMILDIENEFEIKLDRLSCSKIKTLRDVVRFVNEKLQKEN